jgi:hypothetical protein
MIADPRNFSLRNFMPAPLSNVRDSSNGVTALTDALYEATAAMIFDPVSEWVFGLARNAALDSP